MAKKRLPEFQYHYQGPTERLYRGGRGYRRCNGYILIRDGIKEYPVLTKTECRKDARSQGGKAVFYRDGRRE